MKRFAPEKMNESALRESTLFCLFFQNTESCREILELPGLWGAGGGAHLKTRPESRETDRGSGKTNRDGI